MNKEEITKRYIVKLRECMIYGDNFETGHIEADKIVEELLGEIGFGDVARAYNQVGKWYS